MVYLTSGNGPNTAFRDGKLGHVSSLASANLDHHFSLVHHEAHLHLTAVLRTLEAFWWKLDHASAEEGQRHDLRVLEV